MKGAEHHQSSMSFSCTCNDRVRSILGARRRRKNHVNAKTNDFPQILSPSPLSSAHTHACTHNTTHWGQHTGNMQMCDVVVALLVHIFSSERALRFCVSRTPVLEHAHHTHTHTRITRTQFSSTANFAQYTGTQHPESFRLSNPCTRTHAHDASSQFPPECRHPFARAVRFQRVCVCHACVHRTYVFRGWVLFGTLFLRQPKAFRH